MLYENIAIKAKNAPERVLDVCQDKDGLGMLIIYYDYLQLNQRFDIYTDSSSVYFVSKKTGKYLTVGAESDKNGAPIFEEPESNLASQKFKL